MGMSTHVIGLRSDNDPTYKKHAKVLEACNEAGIEKLPKETALYFKSDYPDLDLLTEALIVKIPTKDYSADMQEGYEIDVKSIPAGVEKIRFYNSY